MVFSLKPDIPCFAYVDREDIYTGGGLWRWKVTVKTAPFLKSQFERVYFIDAYSDTLAAHEGIRRFVEEARRGQLRLELRTVH